MKRDAKNLAMSGKKAGGIFAVAIVVLIVAALIDGGEEPLHPIDQELDLPERTR